MHQQFGAGFVAIQQGKIVEILSAKFKSRLIAENTTDRELAAIDLALAKLNDRIDWRQVVIYTDHLPLIGLLKTNRLNDCHNPWPPSTSRFAY